MKKVNTQTNSTLQCPYVTRSVTKKDTISMEEAAHILLSLKHSKPIINYEGNKRLERK